MIQATDKIEEKNNIETALIDAELFAKYKSPEKAFKILRKAIKIHPQSISLREKMLEISRTYKNLDEASEQCLALTNLYTVRKDLDLAYERLQEAKTLDPRVSVGSRLEAIRQAYKNDKTFSKTGSSDIVFSGDIRLISIFDVVQTIENSLLTGLLVIKSEKQIASIAFNDGKIVDAQINGEDGISAFKEIIEINEGKFEFSISEDKFPEVINVSSNKNFLLNTVATLDAEKAEKLGKRDLSQEEIGF